jgi:SM-20-related protein
MERASYIRLPEFLSPEENLQIFDYANFHQLSFVDSKVTPDAVNFRRSAVLYDLDDIGIKFESRIGELMPEVLEQFSILPPTQLRFETQLTVSNDGDFFKPHIDNGTLEISHRIVTYVYYFHRVPQAYRGGQLRLYDLELFKDLNPKNNLLVLFPSWVLHEVLPVICPSRQFADGRFTINGWVGNTTNFVAPKQSVPSG